MMKRILGAVPDAGRYMKSLLAPNNGKNKYHQAVQGIPAFYNGIKGIKCRAVSHAEVEE